MPTSKRSQLIAWCFYEWGSQAYPVIVISYVFSVYFTKHIASNTLTGTYQWSNAITIASIFIAIISPFVGSIADHYGKHKKWLLLFASISMICTSLLWFAYPHAVFYTLFIVVIGTVAFEIANVFFNAYLFFLAPAGFVGRLSGWAWGLGYLGGLLILIIALYAFLKSPPAWLDKSQAEQIRICGPFAAVWFAIFAMPLFIFVPDTPDKHINLKAGIVRGIQTTFSLFKQFREDKNVLIFLIARMFYNDGLTTLFAFGGIYLSGTMGMSIEYILYFGIIAHITAGAGAITLAWADDYFGSKWIIQTSLCCFVLGICVLLISNSLIVFWIVALFCSLFIGPIQAASRSILVRIAPPEKISEMFGLYAFSGKASTFLGPWFFGVTTYLFKSQSAGMATILLFFICGGIILCYVTENQMTDQ